jgi:hypothetical protein
MTIKVRKQVYIEPHQEEILKRLTRETGISEAELIRQAIDRHTRTFIPRPDLKAWEKERTFIVHLMLYCAPDAAGPCPWSTDLAARGAT